MNSQRGKRQQLHDLTKVLQLDVEFTSTSSNENLCSTSLLTFQRFLPPQHHLLPLRRSLHPKMDAALVFAGSVVERTIIITTLDPQRIIFMCVIFL